MERTLLKDYYMKHPDAKMMDDGKYPLDTNSEREAILCARDVGYNVPCTIDQDSDCRSCWERNAKFDGDGSFIKLVAPF